MIATAENKTEILNLTLMWMGAMLAYGAPGVWLWQLLTWYQYSYWPQLAVGDAWRWSGTPFPQIPVQWGMVEVQMEFWLLDQPLSFALLVTGVVAIWLGRKI